MIVLEMGTKPTNGDPLAEALFSSVQRRVLALLFGSPERSFQSAEVIRLVKGGTGGVHRELCRLEKAGWLTIARIGNQKHYQVNAACPGFLELRGLVLKTLGGARAVNREARPIPRPDPQPESAAERAAESAAAPAPLLLLLSASERPGSPPEPGIPGNDGWKNW
jgi:hypothetical protein